MVEDPSFVYILPLENHVENHGFPAFSVFVCLLFQGSLRRFPQRFTYMYPMMGMFSILNIGI